MELEKNWRKIQKNGADRNLNQGTQPTRDYAVFNNPIVVTESWYPILPAKKLKKKQIYSFPIGAQRIVVFRDESGGLGALDAFCPHMGADLSNGKVIGDKVQCYFHQWEFTRKGELAKIPCRANSLPNIKTQSYPVEEKYGYIWVYSGPVAPYPVPKPPGFEDQEVDGIFVGSPQLFVHHHVLMVSAIDLQHFGAVHKLNFDFSFDVQTNHQDQYVWKVNGLIPNDGWRAKLAKRLIGDKFEYQALFSGGSVVSINYGLAPLPAVNILWGCIPLENGTSRAFIFLVQPKAKNWIQKARNFARYLWSVAVLTVLRDDDVKAYPHMRFNTENLIQEDKSAALLISFLNKVKVSKWSFASSRSLSGSFDINS